MTTTDRAHAAHPARLVIWPSRSLGQLGSRLLPSAVAAIFAVVALWAARIGAWPVALYALLAAAGFASALSFNNRAARITQELEFASGQIRVRTRGPAAPIAEAEEFNPHWVRLVEQIDRYAEPRLTLEQSGRRVAIGDFLGPDERRQLAEDLRTWLHHCRTETITPTRGPVPPRAWRH